MRILWFKSAKRTFLPPRIMWLGMLLACFAWVMQLSPLFAPLWLDNVTAGHGLCIKLAPLVESHQHRQHSQDISAQNSHHHEHQDLTHLTQADRSKNFDSDKKTFHDCDICLALLAFDVPTFDFQLIIALVLAYCLLVQAIYRSLLQRFVAFLHPPSRASPTFHFCF